MVSSRRGKQRIRIARQTTPGFGNKEIGSASAVADRPYVMVLGGTGMSNTMTASCTSRFGSLG